MHKYLLLIVIALFISCENGSGEGGTSVIQGQVFKIHTFQNSSTGFLDTTYYQLDSGKDVYIIYSNNSQDLYDDKFETDHNGRYRFEFLRKGDYLIYTYADSTQLVGLMEVKYEYPIFKQVKISSNNSTIYLDDFIIEKNQ